MTGYFDQLIHQISPTPIQQRRLDEAYKLLVKQILGNTRLASCVIEHFLQGSYKRGTLIQPRSGQKPDVDICIVTNYTSNQNLQPAFVLRDFFTFFDRYHAETYKFRNRAFQIELPYVNADIMVTILPDKTDWPDATHYKKYLIGEDRPRQSGLLMPNLETDKWEFTDPLYQNYWAQNKNDLCNSHYLDVVKCIKWWAQGAYRGERFPRGYYLEYLVGACCPNGITSVAEGIASTLKNMVKFFEGHLTNHFADGQNCYYLYKSRPGSTAQIYGQENQ